VLVPGDRLAVIRRGTVRDFGGVVRTGGAGADVAHPSGFAEGPHLRGPLGHLRLPGAVDRHQGEGVVVRVLHLHLAGALATAWGEGLHPVAVLVHPQLVGGDRVTVVV